MRLVIDFSVMAHKSFHQMFTPNYEQQMKVIGKNEKGQDIIQPWTELEEFSRNLCINLFYIKSLYKPDDIVLCLDAPSNWRADYVKEWYHSRLEVFELLEEGTAPTFYVTFDKVQHSCTYVSQLDKWVVNKVKVSELFDPENRECRSYNYEEIKGHDVWKFAIQKKLVPYYKGTRKNSNWVAFTPKEEFKAETARLGKELAPLLGAISIMVDKAEGDDIVTMSVLDSACYDPNEEVVVVSIDQDLYQLASMHPNLTYYNPNLRTEIPLRDDVARLKLIHKIVGGDTSDNIKGISLKNGKRPMPCVGYDAEGVVKNGKGTAEYVDKALEQGLVRGHTGAELFNPAYVRLTEDSVIDTFYRNLILVYLGNIPQVIQDEINKRLMNDKVLKTDKTWEDYGFSKKDRISVMNSANNDSEEIRG